MAAVELGVKKHNVQARPLTSVTPTPIITRLNHTCRLDLGLLLPLIQKNMAGLETQRRYSSCGVDRPLLGNSIPNKGSLRQGAFTSMCCKIQLYNKVQRAVRGRSLQVGEAGSVTGLSLVQTQMGKVKQQLLLPSRCL